MGVNTFNAFSLPLLVAVAVKFESELAGVLAAISAFLSVNMISTVILEAVVRAALTSGHGRPTGGIIRILGALQDNFGW